MTQVPQALIAQGLGNVGTAGNIRKAHNRLPTAAAANSVELRMLPRMASGGGDCCIRTTRFPCLGLSSMKIVFAKPTHQAITIQLHHRFIH